MAINRKQFTPAELKFFKAFDRWKLKGPPPNVFTGWMRPGEAALKAAREPDLLKATWTKLQIRLDPSKEWDKLLFDVVKRLEEVSLYYLFTGDRRAVAPALEAVALLEACKRPYWTYSTCLGVLDMDLRTAELVRLLVMMKDCMGDALDAGAIERLRRLVVDRILRPGLEAERNKTYPWMHSRANWRIILCGSFATGAMAFADDCPDYRELIEYGLEGVLTALGTGDSAGGWNEGPGYWDYGLSHAVFFAYCMKTFTGGAVDLLKHPFLQKTGDFRLFMHTRTDAVWNWSDSGKKVGPSVTLIGLARATQNPAYQWLALAQPFTSLQQLYYSDLALKPQAPPAGRPVHRFFPGLGVLVWRGGFGRQDNFVGVKEGDIPHFNHHCHMDLGNLVIYAGGRELLGELTAWAYPAEGAKDPKKKGHQPGYYDLENKRWMRWDFDNVSAAGHNILTLEGCYPQPFNGAKARFLERVDAARYSSAIIDSTSVYRPLAKRVRRFIVYLHHDVVLLVDEVRAFKPVKARVQFHPAAGAEWGSDAFVFANGPARLAGTSLFPAKTDHLVIGMEERKTTYQLPSGLVEKDNRFVYVENLCRKPRLVFITALQFGAKGFSPAAYSLEGAPGSDEVFAVTVKRGRRSARVGFDLGKACVSVKV